MHRKSDSPHREVTIGEAAERVGVSATHVERLIASGRRPAFHAHAGARVRIKDLESHQRAVDGRHAGLDALMDETEALGLY